MTRDILSASDLTRSDLDRLLSFSFQEAPTPPASLQGKKIVIARYDGNAAPLDDLEELLYDQGGEVQSAPPPPSGQPVELIARQLDTFNAHAVIFNHPANDSAKLAADIVRAPLLNTGDGTNENPARGLIDLHTILRAKGSLDGLRVAFLGNLRFGAEAHSLTSFLSLFDVRLSLVSPAALSMPYDLTDDLRASGIEIEETNDLTTTLRKSDVLYLSRIDPTRVEAKVYEKAKNFYQLGPEILKDAKAGLFVLGEWDGAERLLAAGSAFREKSFKAMIPVLLEYAMR